MLSPRLPDLFEPIVIVRPAAHSVQILRDERVIGVRQLKPIEWLVTVVAGRCSHSEPDEVICSIVAALLH
jgi:hypothetical protein